MLLQSTLIPTIENGQAGASGAPLSVHVVERVAQGKGVDVVTLPPLSDVIDPDALDALFQAEWMHGQVTFTYLDYAVTVHDDGEIDLDPND